MDLQDLLPALAALLAFGAVGWLRQRFGAGDGSGSGGGSEASGSSDDDGGGGGDGD